MTQQCPSQFYCPTVRFNQRLLPPVFIQSGPQKKALYFLRGFPLILSQGRGVFKASRQLDRASGTRCRTLLLQLGHAEGTLPPVPHHKPLWTSIIRHHASFPPDLQVCTTLVTPSHVLSQDTFPTGRIHSLEACARPSPQPALVHRGV